MKKLAFFSILFIILFSSFTPALAKPTYCWDALSQCTAACDQTFGWPFSEACRGGCGIGFLSCGG